MCFTEMGANRATHSAAGPLLGHLSLHSRVKDQDGALQRKRAKTGKKGCLVVGVSGGTV